LSRQQVRAFDRWAIDQLGIPGVVLMENAGRSCAELIKEKLSEKADARICIFCGTGNNGGDGYVIARHLINFGFTVFVVICGDEGTVKGDAKINLDILRNMGRQIEQINLAEDNPAQKVKALAENADMAVDALFGTGLKGRLNAPLRNLIDAINNCSCPKLAVDIPSGMDCDTGKSLGAVINASFTVTFAAVKKGFEAAGAKKHTGQIYVASIGIEPPAKSAD